MKTKKHINLLIASVVILFASCKKDNNGTDPIPTVDCNSIENGISMEDDCGTCHQSYMYAGMGQLTYVATYADTVGVDGTFVLAGSAMDIAQNPLWNAGCISAPNEYSFTDGTGNPASTVAYSGQTTRLLMAKQLVDALKNGTHDLSQLQNMWTSGTGFADGLDNPGKVLRSKTSASPTSSATVQVQLDELLVNFSDEVYANWNTDAVAGTGGEYSTGNSGRVVHINSKGMEIDQCFAKSLIGALCLDQTANKYCEASYQAGLNNVDRDPAEDNNATEMEHKWDEGFGYVYGHFGPDNINGDLSADALLGKYLNKSGFETEKEAVFEAFKLGRAAISHSEPDANLRDAQSVIIKAELSKVIAGKAVAYLEDAADLLETEGDFSADYFHSLSEGWGFILSLQYSDWYSNSDVNAMLAELEAGDGFWSRTATELDEMAASIKSVTGI
jgi:hypothetical protein